MLFTYFKRSIAVIVLVVCAVHLGTFVSPASAEWRDNSDQLPGMEDSSDAVASGAVVALAIAAVVGVVYAIATWGNKPPTSSEPSVAPEYSTNDLPGLHDLTSVADLTQSGSEDTWLVTGLSVKF